MVTSPKKDEKLDFSKTIEIKWTSVSTDPSTFDLVLVDQSNMTPIPVGDKVKTSDGSFSLTNFVATPGAKYKFNLLSTDPQNTGILAQSETFEVTKSGGSDTSSESVSSTTTTSSTSTGTAASETTDSTSSSASTTLSTKTTSGSPSKTGSASTSETANASSTGAAPVASGNAAVALTGKTVGVAGSIFAGLLMLL